MSAESIALHIEAVQNFLAQIQGSKAAEKVLKAKQTHLEDSLSVAALSPAQAPRIVAGIRGLGFSPSVVERLVELASDRVHLDGPSPAGRPKLQVFRALPAYFSSAHWASLLSETASSSSKLELLLRHSMSLGLRHPNEMSLQTMVGLYIGCSEGVSKGIALPATIKYSLLQHVKKTLRAMAKVPDVQGGYITTLPALPSELADARGDLWARAFADSSTSH